MKMAKKILNQKFETRKTKLYLGDKTEPIY